MTARPEKIGATAGDWAITVRLTAWIVLLLTAATALFLMVASRQFEGTLHSLLDTRFNSVVLRLKTAVEANLSLGLPLAGLRSVPGLLKDEWSRDPTILSIDLFDDTGRLLFTTDRGGAGDSVPPAWLEAVPAAGRDIWVRPEEGGVVIGTPLVNTFGKRVGGIALRYSEGLVSAVSGATVTDLALHLLPVLAAGIAVLAFGVHRLLRPINRHLGGLARTVATAAPAAATSAATAAAVPDWREIDGTVAAFAEYRAAVRQDLQDVRAEIRRIDDDG